MLRKEDRPFFFTEPQKALLRNRNIALQRLNRKARRELRRIGWFTLTHKQYREAGLILRQLATRMKSVVRFREEILDFGREQQPTRTQLVIAIVCGDCPITGDEPRDPLTDSDQIPEINSTHLPELESLVEFTQKMGDRLWSRLRIPPDVFVSGLKRLTDALLKQRRHLRNIGPNQGATK